MSWPRRPGLFTHGELHDHARSAMKRHQKLWIQRVEPHRDYFGWITQVGEQALWVQPEWTTSSIRIEYDTIYRMDSH